MANATLTNIKGFLAARADLTLTIDRAVLEEVMVGQKTLEAQIADGTARVPGDVTALTRLAPQRSANPRRVPCIFIHRTSFRLLLEPIFLAAKWSHLA